MGMLGVDQGDLLRVFVLESEERLSEMEENLLALEAEPEALDRVDAVFRGAHTIKGNAAALGMGGMTSLAHVLEDMLEGMRSRALPVTAERVTTMLEAVDVLRELVPLAVRGEDLLSDSGRALLERMASERLELGIGTGSAPGTQPAGVEELPAEPGMISSSVGQARGRTLRVDREKLDLLLDLLGEIAVARGRLGQVLAHLEEGGEAQEIHREADHLYMELQELVMRSRMVPLGPVFRRQSRTVRDLGLEIGKVARLQIEGLDVEVDAAIVEQLKDPLTHMIRNAIDHGLETPAVRISAGKDPCGTIKIWAFHDAGSVVIQVSDDGGGIDRGRIAERARALGLAADPEALTDDELLSFIFEPGFSTATTTTKLSGRGVGMDVVRREVEALRGTVSVASKRGEGTTVAIRVPLTLAIIDAFLVGAAAETYVIPLEFVLECLELPLPDREKAAGHGVINVRGKAVPYIRLRDLLALEKVATDRESIVLVRQGDGMAGLVVDRLLGQQQAVIKPLGKPLQHLPGIAGSTVLGDGRVALILDVSAFLEMAGSDASRGRSGGAAA
jgi:two-component system chemotaxis sensor kinase CheA